MRICATCAVEYDEPLPAVCPICADERQWVPSSGQAWTSLRELRARGTTVKITELEPRLLGIDTDPAVGIGQRAKLVITPKGSVLWDPTGYLDDSSVAEIRSHGRVLAIAASHPHMFGVQLEWAAVLDAPVLVCDPDADWLGRRGKAIELWSGAIEIVPGVTIHQIGGHFPGSSALYWAAGAGGRGVLLVGDTVAPNPDRTSVAFMRSYPNRIPLSGAKALEIGRRLAGFGADRLYGNFAGRISTDAVGVLLRSAERHAAWARGDHDDLT